jgi:hypothetical protein
MQWLAHVASMILLVLRLQPMAFAPCGKVGTLLIVWIASIVDRREIDCANVMHMLDGSGLSATVFRTLPGTSFYFTVLHSFTRAFPVANNRYEARQPTPRLHFRSKHTADVSLSSYWPSPVCSPLGALALAATSRTTVAVSLMPFTVLKTRMEAGKEGYNTLSCAIRTMLFRERFTRMCSFNNIGINTMLD